MSKKNEYKFAKKFIKNGVEIHNILMDDCVAKNFQDTSNNTKSFDVAYSFQVLEYVANSYSLSH